MAGMAQALNSRGVSNALGGADSLTHKQMHRVWRDAQHKQGLPTCVMRGVVEPHTLPESLMMLSNVLTQQMETSMHDTQVSSAMRVYVHLSVRWTRKDCCTVAHTRTS